MTVSPPCARNRPPPHEEEAVSAWEGLLEAHRRSRRHAPHSGGRSQAWWLLFRSEVGCLVANGRSTQVGRVRMEGWDLETVTVEEVSALSLCTRGNCWTETYLCGRQRYDLGQKWPDARPGQGQVGQVTGRSRLPSLGGGVYCWGREGGVGGEGEEVRSKVGGCELTGAGGRVGYMAQDTRQRLSRVNYRSPAWPGCDPG